MEYQARAEPVDLAEATERFAGWYFSQKKESLNCDIILVGHGLGGIMILNFLTQRLEQGASKDFFNLRQVLLYAVPHLGYREVARTVRFRNRLFGNSLLDILKQWESQLPKINELAKEYIIDPVEFNSYYRPVSVQCFGGNGDQVVSPESAQGDWPNFELLTGDHLSILTPFTKTDQRYLRFSNCILNPPPHQGIYFVKELNTAISVEPFTEGTYTAKYGDRTRLLQPDNYGTIFRQVRFDSRNRCFEPYQLRYSIENEKGYIKAMPSGGENITAPKNQQAYEARGLEYFFEFVPEIETDYSLLVELYKGFDKGYRDAHFHLGNGSTRFGALRLTLDLSRYLEAGFSLKPEPKLMLHPEDTHSCNDRFSERSPDRVIPQEPSSGGGLWVWQINDIGGGVIDLFWDLESK